MNLALHPIPCTLSLDLFVLPADEVGAVFSLEAADGEVALGQALEVVGEEDVEG